jgi:hypothetical protein
LKETDSVLLGLVKKLHRYPINRARRSLREIAAESSAQGYLNASGKPFAPASIKRFLAK